MEQGDDFTCACPFEASVGGETSGSGGIGSGGIGERLTGDGNLGVRKKGTGARGEYQVDVMPKAQRVAKFSAVLR